MSGPEELRPGEEETRIQDVEEAQVGAYAEKPFRDALVEYRDSLSEEAQKSLDWIASREGEEAIAAYREEKAGEDPVTRVLRERAEEILTLNLD